jgi:hypothetical protein
VANDDPFAQDEALRLARGTAPTHAVHHTIPVHGIDP